MDVSANQDEMTDSETFQLEQDTKTGKWSMRTAQDKYITVMPGGGVQAGDKKSDQGLFEFVWHEDGSVCLLAANGISNKK